KKKKKKEKKMITFLYKPKKISSAKFLRQWSKTNLIKKAGHAGTLDPLASGLLLVATEDDTKLLQYLDQKTKTYLAKIQFGFWSTTYDAEGQIYPVEQAIKVTKDNLEQALNRLSESQKQVPPVFSSKKVSGKSAYHYARQGKQIELKPISIKISKTILINFDEKLQNCVIMWQVSRGCYIRSLADDLAKMLKTRAYLCDLERTKIGNFDKKFLNQSLKPQDLFDLQQVKLDLENLELLLQGKKINYFAKNSELNTLIFKDEVVGFGKIINNVLITKKLFGNRIKKIINT
ncbi:tRNA pseudouridine(55) synthase TruB, partial [Mesomycoplasma hyopneumoniae]